MATPQDDACVMLVSFMCGEGDQADSGLDTTSHADDEQGP
jgi:hypothetical protein